MSTFLEIGNLELTRKDSQYKTVSRVDIGMIDRQIFSKEIGTYIDRYVYV